MDGADWNTIKVLLATVAILGLVIKGLLDFLKSRKPSQPGPPTADQITAIANAAAASAADTVATVLRESVTPLLTKVQADTMIATTAKDMVEDQVSKVPCYGSRDGDCAKKIKEHWQTKRTGPSLPPQAR